MSIVTCKKCGKSMSEGRYKNHIANVLNPCDNICFGCGTKFNNRQSFYNHKKKCKSYKEKSVNVTNVTAGSHNTANNINTTNNNNNSQNFNNNVVLLSPYGLEHRMMEKEVEYREQVLGSARDRILNIVRENDFPLAYKMLFNHIHGNVDRPENHNIFIKDREKDEVCLFTGKQFAYERADQETPGLYRFLMVELKWMVGSADITFKEKDQLLHDIKCHWRLVNEEKDEDIRRMLFNNKPIVENTVNNHLVKPNKDLIEDYYDFKRGTLKSFDMDIHLPE